MTTSMTDIVRVSDEVVDLDCADQGHRRRQPNAAQLKSVTLSDTHA